MPALPGKSTRRHVTPPYCEAAPEKKAAATAASKFARSLAGKDRSKYVHLFWEAYHLATDPHGRRRRCPNWSGHSTETIELDHARVADGENAAYMRLLETPAFLRHETARIRAGISGLEIIGGIDVAYNDLPDCVAIGTMAGSAFQLVGTGTLVGPRTVVTAAHVVRTEGAPLTVVFGNNVNAPGPNAIRQGVGHVHPGYVWSPFAYNIHDIAVIVLDMNAGSAQRAIASAAATNMAQGFMIAGFGATDQNATVGMGVKRYAYVSRAGDTATEIIAGPSTAPGYVGDSCAGDSGGPLYTWDGAQYLLSAVVSRTLIGSAVRCGPGSIYTRVDSHRPFIAQFI